VIVLAEFARFQTFQTFQPFHLASHPPPRFQSFQPFQTFQSFHSMDNDHEHESRAGSLEFLKCQYDLLAGQLASPQ
jgi:hypothetical protein